MQKLPSLKKKTNTLEKKRRGERISLRLLHKDFVAMSQFIKLQVECLNVVVLKNLSSSS